jgi:ABC-type transport system involved in multi-copper enzyme maturation permease subunit
MNHTLAIARREIAEKRFALAAPAASALIIMLLPLLPHVRQNVWREIYAGGSAVIAITFTTGLALILGASIVGRELSDRRLSFYFAKPVSAQAIWLGKLIAALLMIAATCGIAAIPGLIAGGEVFRRTFTNPGEFVMPMAIAIVVLFFSAHVVSTIARSHSAWALFDAAAIALSAYACWWILQPLVTHDAVAMWHFVAKVFGWLLLIVVIAAGGWQLAKGRTDRLQSHRALSLFLWPAVAIAIAICGLIVAWVVAARPDDLTGDFAVRSAPQGAYAFISGNAAHRRDYHPLFLMNVRDGKFTRLDGFPLSGGFTPDGKKVLIARPVSGRPSAIGEIVVRDLATGHEDATDLILDTRSRPINVSADGTRMLYTGAQTIAFYDLAEKKSLGSMRRPAGSVMGAWFASPDVVRVYMFAAPAFQIYEYDIRTRSYAKTGEFQRTDKNMYFIASADGSRLFVRDPAAGITMVDGRTGAQLMSFPDVRAVTMLPDGRFLGIAKNQLRIMGAAGVVEREVAVEGNFWSARAIGNDKALLVSSLRNTWKVTLIDVNTGAVIRREDGLQPHYFDQPPGDSRRTSLNPDQLFTDAGGNLVHWNPLTNEKNILIAAKGDPK